MKKQTVGMALVLTLVLACKGGSGGSNETLAIVNGIAITDAEVTKASESQLKKVETQIFQIKRRTLDSLIEDKLLEAAAKKENQSVEEYLKAKVDDTIEAPSEAEMKNLYETQKGTKEPYAQVKPQIENYLMQNRQARAQHELIAKLRKDADVKIMMQPPRVAVEAGDAPSLGSKDAPITIIEFSDYQCPFCKRARPTVWKVLEEYGDKIRYVYRDFPLSFHNFAHKAHEAAHCAGDQGKYFDYNRKLFDNQQNLDIGDLKKYAQELQLDGQRFDACLSNSTYAARVDADIEAGAAAGVSGTPSFFINGIQLSGAQPFEAFKDIIEGELNR
ncbi:MAG: thioredoxin domain-containing protein [Deltaproteobacteria bacterium]|nr:thioredoxin domain-containing protein [Deltaproteobacteria bacterium]